METYESVLGVIKKALWKEEMRVSSDVVVNWDEISQELKKQTVDVLAAEVLGTWGAWSDCSRLLYKQRVTQSVATWFRLMKEQEYLVQVLKTAGVSFAVIKGAAANRYYPRPEYRTVGDIDIVVAPEAFDLSYRTLLNAGYASECNDKVGRHINLKRNGIEVEVHRRFATMSNPELAQQLDDLVFGSITDAEWVHIGAFTFPVLPKLANGLVLLAHIDHHMEHGLGLRQIIDWMFFVDQELDDGWWAREFGEWTRRLKLETEAVTLSRMCQIYLGLREEERFWCSGADEELCRELMLWIMNRGNFGRKLDKSHDAVTVINEIPKGGNIFKQLQQYGRINWEPARKSAFLGKFAWLYQICRYARLGLARKRPLKQLLRDIKQSRREQDFLNRLEVGRRRKARDDF